MMPETATRRRRRLSKDEQLSVFRRDGWLCCWCKKPVIFGPTMRLLEMEVRNAGYSAPLAHYHGHWTRHGAPLLDELGGVLDHVEAFVAGGPCNPDNLATSCAKCNGRKGAETLEKWNGHPKRKPIKGKYGEPQNWDGLTVLFVVLAERNLANLTTTERDWLRAIKSHAG
jgi:hypothetical protein